MSKSKFRAPSLEFYRKKAKKLVKRHRECDPQALNLIKYNHRSFCDLSLSKIAERKFSLRDAQTVVARVDGYQGWTQLKLHVSALNGAVDNASLQFERAANAIVHGDLETLTTLLKNTPRLIRNRSKRNHRSTLLHYIAANGIEQHRQKTPTNAVEIAEFLLESGAEVDALAETYGGGSAQTTLGLLVSSCWPHQAGLQSELVKVLCRYGANPDGVDGNGLPLATALVFFYGKTAQTLAACGARVDHLLAAATVGTPQDIDACFTQSGRLRKQNFVYIGFQLRPPKNRSEMLGQAFVYAAMCGNLANLKHLSSKYNCPVDATADRGLAALHLASYFGNAKIVNWLLKSGANPRIRDQQWNSTPVAWAYQTKQLDIRRKLIRSMELTIHEAVSFFELATLKRLLKQDQELANLPNSDGLYPIHCLHDDTEHGPEIINQLVSSGAQLNSLDSEGRTAVDRLKIHGRKDLIQILKSHGGCEASKLDSD